MDLTSLTSADLNRLSKLLSQKEELLREVATIDAELGRFGSAETSRATVSTKQKPKVKSGRGGRGALKESIIAELQKAGKAGISVKELAAAVGRAPANIYTWFFTTGKKIREIKKVGEARYSWTK